MIKRYTKIPITIEAFLYDGSNNSYIELNEWGMKILNTNRIVFGLKEISNIFYVQIPTLEGIMIASPGDYIICGVKKEFYPCKPYIFKDTYVEASNTI